MENTQSNTKTPSKKVLLGIAGVIALIAVLAVMYVMFRPIPAEGSKSITIEVVGKDGRSEEYKLRTDAEYLRQAMEDADGAYLFRYGERIWYDGGDGERNHGRL